MVERLLQTRAAALVDVLLWECHFERRLCDEWERALRYAGVRAVYNEPYPFLMHEGGTSTDDACGEDHV